jgi:hypothetical protein
MNGLEIIQDNYKNNHDNPVDPVNKRVEVKRKIKEIIKED